MPKIMPLKEGFFVRCFLHMGAALLLASLLVAPLAIAEDQAEAPTDTSVVSDKPVQEKAETDTARTSPREKAKTDTARTSPREKARTDTARTSPRDARLEQTLSELKVRLKLTRVQEMYIRSILKEGMEKQRALSEKAEEGGRQGRRSSMQAMRKQQEDTEKRIEELLSEKQVQEYRKFREEQQEKMRQGGGRRRGRR